MFNCRICSQAPFIGQWFATGSEDGHKKRGSGSGSHRDSENSMEDSALTTGTRPFEPRSQDEITRVVRSWEGYVHPRAKNFWNDTTVLYDVPSQVVSGINKYEDPVLGQDDHCVTWHGDMSEGFPVIRMTRPREQSESSTPLTRVLAFLFADDDSFKELQARPKRAFTMACNNARCINLTHISLD
eukprot:GDKH01020611.1.p1 GENE.GDKH01020611.1~~GDKH01020611.1.p1  ORF type:complete len:185 (-),score=4.24 GDKH01020611.1:129-683(-)